MSSVKKRNPWAWIPTLYFAQGLPYVAVNIITVIMFKRLGISNAAITLYTGWLYLPWVIKPFWSPFVDIIKTKRWWTLMMQWIVGIGFAAVAFAIPTPFFFQLTLAIFWLIGFASATHDIASDGFYMIALEEHEQAAYVGIRSTFYRIATIVGQGVLVIIAGVIESNTGLDVAKFEINADPKIEVLSTATDIKLPEIQLNQEEASSQHFVYTSYKIVMGTKVPENVIININDTTTETIDFATYEKDLKDLVNKTNVANGFAAGQTEIKFTPDSLNPESAAFTELKEKGIDINKLCADLNKKTSKEEINKEITAVITYFPDKTYAVTINKEVKKEDLSGFEQLIKNTFGEGEKDVQKVNNNIAIIGVRLSQPPAEGKQFVYVANFDRGNQSIKLLDDDKYPNRFVFNKDNWDKTAYMIVVAESKITENAVATFKGTSGNIPLAWSIVFGVLSVLFLFFALYHGYILPKPDTDHSANGGKKQTPGEIVNTFVNTFKTFFKKKQILVAMLFMLLYRLPEAQLVKIINPFFLDPVDKGGLGLTTGQVGLVYGTIGIIALTLGGIIGGICASRGGLKKWLWPMALCISLNSLVYIYLSAAQPDPGSFAGLFTICTGMFLDQFGYGFGFTAFMLYMMYFADGPFKTSHYAICTAFMALGMMIPGMWSGWLQGLIGYNHFFIWTLLCCFATWGVTALIKVDPNYGKKNKEPKAKA